MMDEEFDFYYWPIDLSYASELANNHNIEIGKLALIDAFSVGQILKKSNKLNESDFSLFLIENIRLLAIILIGFILTVTAKLTLFKLIKRRYTGLRNLLTINRTRFGSIWFKAGFLSLAFSIFLFFNLSILTNLIKTEKVTVDTSEFIDSISKLNRTTKTLIAWDTNSTNAFYRLFKKTKPTDAIAAFDYASVEDFISKVWKRELDCYFYFMGEGYFTYVIYYITLNGSADYIAFFKQTIYFENLRVMLNRKNLDKKLKQILNRR